MSAPKIGQRWQRKSDGVAVSVVGYRSRDGEVDVLWRAENNNRGATSKTVFQRNYIPIGASA